MVHAFLRDAVNVQYLFGRTEEALCQFDYCTSVFLVLNTACFTKGNADGRPVLVPVQLTPYLSESCLLHVQLPFCPPV